MCAVDRRPYQGDRAVLATMHGKEAVIAPLAERFLGARLRPTGGLDTDAFGTFTRDVARAGSQLDAARAKISAVFDMQPDLRLGLASEGSFGPHPYLPFCALEREIVLLNDRGADLELIGQPSTCNTNFAHMTVTDVASGLFFAKRAVFPSHGIIVMGCREDGPAHDVALIKSAENWDDLASSLDRIVSANGSAFIETDMRAHRNPLRMRAIKRATIDLIRRVHTPCPECERPGYAVTEHLAGLPCSWCSEPTLLTRAEVLSCKGCGLRVERPVAMTHADPVNCGGCNP